MNREVELKFRLPDQASADALAREAGEVLETVEQVNHVFDAPDRALRAAGLTLRLRHEAGRWKATLKGPSRRIGAAVDREELEVPLGASEAARILDGGGSLLDAFAASHEGAPLLETARGLAASVRSLGSFGNRRTRVRVHVPEYGEAKLEIDRTELPGHRVDHEVELELEASRRRFTESAAEAEAWLRDLLAQIGVEARPSSGKTGRFLTALDGP